MGKVDGFVLGQRGEKSLESRDRWLVHGDLRQRQASAPQIQPLKQYAATKQTSVLEGCLAQASPTAQHLTAALQVTKHCRNT